MRRLAATLTDAAWLTVLCVTAVPSIVRAGRAKAAEVHREADADWEAWEHEMEAAS